MSARKIEAYRRRLAKIAESTDPRFGLTSECLGAVVEVGSSEWDGLLIGTLVGFRHYQSPGLFGMVIATDVTICTACVGRHGDCGADDEENLSNAWVTNISRNDTPDLLAAGLLGTDKASAC